MKQKIYICGALRHEPKMIFLDEPTVGLDTKSARNLKSLLRTLCDKGMTAFISTHILEIAEQMCDRIGIIADGQIIALGTMDELRQYEGNTDRKSTRLNSSHVSISYAVFCLKKKKNVN